MSAADPRDGWGRLTRAERNAAYDNNAATSDSAALVAARNAASAAFRAEHAGHLDLPYGSRERQKWDIYPAADPGAPVLIFIHGGYWQRNAREFFAIMAEGALQRGLAVAMPGYTLAPEATLTEIVDEIRLALDWLEGESAAHGAGGPAIVTGWSAGAHLAAMALDHPHVRAGLGISGVYELGPIRDTDLNAPLNLSDEEIARLSPLRLPRRQSRSRSPTAAPSFPRSSGIPGSSIGCGRRRTRRAGCCRSPAPTTSPCSTRCASRTAKSSRQFSRWRSACDDSWPSPSWRDRPGSFPGHPRRPLTGSGSHSTFLA